MPRRHHRARRVPRRAVYRFYVLLASIAVLTFGVGCFFFGCPPEQRLHSLWSTMQAASARSLRRAEQNESSHLIYPYSIVAGGVHSPDELREAIETDPVAAAHYAGFKLAKGHVIRLQHDTYAYLSFRVGDNIYWTSHKVSLRKGETLLTDGERYIRTRCGNRLSQEARLPTYRHEPSESVLNTPEKESETAVDLPPITFLPELSPGPDRTPAPAGPISDQAVYTPLGYTPFLPFSTVPGCTQKNSSNKDCGTTQDSPPPPPVAPTPENSAWILFLSGAAILGGYRMGKKAITQQ